MQRLQVIDSLMEAHPQAAYDSLCRFDSLEVAAPQKVDTERWKTDGK